MSDDSAVSQSSALLTPDETGFSAVLAHSMLGTVAAIRGAIEYAMASGRMNAVRVAFDQRDPK